MGTLINGIKEIFASASQTSPTNIPTCAADGTPNGNITIANLASVLGVPTNIRRIGTGANLNDYTQQGIWYLDIGSSTGVANVPPSFYYGVVVSITASNQTLQYAADANGFWSRRGDSGNFSTWIRCDNFGCNTLSDLANALGVCKYYDIDATECNCTTSPLIDVGFFTIIRCTNFVEAPLVTGILYTFRGLSTLYFQVFIPENLNAIYIRPRGKTWVKIWE